MSEQLDEASGKVEKHMNGKAVNLVSTPLIKMTLSRCAEASQRRKGDCYNRFIVMGLP